MDGPMLLRALRFSFVLGAGVFVGCSRPSAQTAERHVSPTTSVPPVRADAGESPVAKRDFEVTVAWVRDKKGKITSWFLAPNAKPEPRSGLYLAVGSHLYKWSERVKKQRAPACPAGNTNPYTEYELATVSLEEVEGTSKLDPFPRAADAGDADEDVAKDLYAPIASLGPYLFAREELTYWPCGMHPQYGVEFHAFELTETMGVKKLAAADLFEGSERRLDDAVLELNAHASKDDSMDNAVGRNEVQTTLARPIFGGADLNWQVQFTARATWAGSYGDWAGYTRSVVLPLPEVPAKFRAFAALAERAKTLGLPHTDDVIAGVSAGNVHVPKPG